MLQRQVASIQESLHSREMTVDLERVSGKGERDS